MRLVNYREKKCLLPPLFPRALSLCMSVRIAHSILRDCTHPTQKTGPPIAHTFVAQKGKEKDIGTEQMNDSNLLSAGATLAIRTNRTMSDILGNRGRLLCSRILSVYVFLLVRGCFHSKIVLLLLLFAFGSLPAVKSVCVLNFAASQWTYRAECCGC